MGSFSASLKTLGDRHALPATITIDHGRLSIDAGDQPIGDWALEDIHLEPTGTGYRMAAEGEQILIELPDLDGFSSELNARLRKKRRGLLGETRAKKVPAHEPSSQIETKKLVKLEKAPDREEAGTKAAISKIDRVLAAAEKRWGSLLPAWVFSRLTLGLAVLGVAITVLFPGLISLLMLLAGVLLVMSGSIVYTDQVLAAKWLPGRMTPMHVLIFGVGVLVLGVLVGVIS